MNRIEAPRAVRKLRHWAAERNRCRRRFSPLLVGRKLKRLQERLGLKTRPFCRVPPSRCLEIDCCPFLSGAGEHLGLFDPVTIPPRRVDVHVAQARRFEPAVIFILLLGNRDQPGDEHVGHDLAAEHVLVGHGRHHRHVQRGLHRLRHWSASATAAGRLLSFGRIAGIQFDGAFGRRSTSWQRWFLGQDRHAGDRF